MNILIVGCRKVGSSLANYLNRMGHDVSIVDKDPESFELLDDDFTGFTLTGIPIDQDVLKRAGIVGCDALAAVSPDDNVNVMVSQVAKEFFHVPKVIARIYDPQRKDVFSHFGLTTICPTNLTVEAIYSMLSETDETKQMTLDASILAFDTAPIPDEYVNRDLGHIPARPDAAVFAVLHRDGSIHLAALNPHKRTVATDRLVYVKVVD